MKAVFIIAAKPDSATNPQAPIWLGRATGSGHWADFLVEFVNAAKTSKQPNAVLFYRWRSRGNFYFGDV